MTKSKHTLIAWLRDVHAMERASVDSLDRMADRLARFPELAAGLREHWRQSLARVQQIEACMKKIGTDTSTFKDLASRFIGIAQSFAVEVASDEVVKECCAAYSWRHFEIACYLSLGAAAAALEELDIARMCEQYVQQERVMAAWLEEQIPEVTRVFLRP
jgi:ferritin-like metal-binding protein YciE